MFCLYGGSSFEAFQVASNGPAGWLIHDPLNGDAARAKLVLQAQAPPITKWTHILMQTRMHVNMKIGKQVHSSSNVHHSSLFICVSICFFTQGSCSSLFARPVQCGIKTLSPSSKSPSSSANPKESTPNSWRSASASTSDSPPTMDSTALLTKLTRLTLTSSTS